MFAENRMTGDVLVVGGGMAGCFAAIKAAGQGADVILVDKGYVGKTGQSAMAQDLMVFAPDLGHNFDEWMCYLNKTGEYVNNRYWTERTIKESPAIYRELLSWGMPFNPYDGNAPGSFSSAPKGLSNPRTYNPKELSRVLRDTALQRGVKILDRVMITELLKQDGRIVGAIGITPDGEDLYTFITKATIFCVGACGFKPAGFSPIIQLTCDGEAMGYRAGVEIGGKEFVDTHYTKIDCPSETGRMRLSPDLEKLFRKKTGLGSGDLYNNENNIITSRPPGASEYKFTYLQLEIEAHEGRTPIFSGQNPDDDELVGGAALGMSVRKADGLWPANADCGTSVPGLYAAGDSLYTIQNGAAYALLGSSMSGSAMTGSAAGTAAAKEALSMEEIAVSEEEIARAKGVVLAPMERRGGYSPRWVTQLLQNTMMPYFVSYIKKEDRLKAALTTIAFMQEHLVPKMYAEDAHELRLAHEAKNMVLSAEMRLKSALFRTESRGNHYREDYPRRDDTNWLAWIKIREEQGEMKLIKVPVPKEWTPDLSVPYEERYPFRFPGEE